MSDDIAQAVQDSGGQPSTVRIGTVVSTTPLQIDLGGRILGLEAVGVLTPYTPSAGDVIALLGQSVEGAQATGSSWLCLGAIVASTSGLLSQNGVQVFAAAQSAGAGYVDLTGVTFTFTKRRPGSRILAHMAGSCYANTVGGGAEFSARLTSATYTSINHNLASQFFNVANTHLSCVGFRHLSGIPAGTYTVQGAFHLYVGGGNVITDGNDRISLMLTEVD